MRVLVTGGAGYIGSHTIVELLQQNHQVIVIDNLSNSSKESLTRIGDLTGHKVYFHNFDLVDEQKLNDVFKTNSIDAVIHFAGLKSVSESVNSPLLYYQNNVETTLILCKVMLKNGVHKLVFSSSAVVYGNPSKVPVDENMPIHPVNPYGQTKAVSEQLLNDLAAAKNGWQISVLRYFNPIGAHESGLIGEDPNDTPNNLVPYISQVAIGTKKELSIYGDNYNTPDGTGIRDYVDVVDVAKGHLAALSHLPNPDNLAIYNLGRGKGCSVMEVVNAFEQASGKKIPYKIVERRAGDIGSCYANVQKANAELGWKATKSLFQSCLDAWRWQSKNPNGYR